MAEINEQGNPILVAADASKSLWSRRNLWRVLAVAVALGATGLIFAFKDWVLEFQSYLYVGVFLINLLASATIFVPVPGVVVIFALGAHLNPVLLGLAGGVGSGLGEITGYLAGLGGQAALEKHRAYRQLEAWMRHWGSLAVVVFAFIPNPLFDLLGMAAGALRFSLSKFLLAACLARVPRSIGLALLGALAADVDWVQRVVNWLF